MSFAPALRLIVATTIPVVLVLTVCGVAPVGAADLATGALLALPVSIAAALASRSGARLGVAGSALGMVSAMAVRLGGLATVAVLLIHGKGHRPLPLLAAFASCVVASLIIDAIQRSRPEQEPARCIHA